MAELGYLVALGLQTNGSFLAPLVSSSDFTAANLERGLIDRTLARWLDPGHPVRLAFIALATAALLKREEISTKADPAHPFSHWREPSGCLPKGEYIRTVDRRSS